MRKSPMTKPPKPFISWYINTECNYSCSYCKPENYKTRRAPLEEIIKFWDSMFERYGSCHVTFSGGEPFVYPGFIKLLGAMTEHHTVELSTNLSADMKELVRNVNLDKLRLGASFHPDCADFEEFIGKIRFLRDYDFEKWVTFVAYPGQLGKLEEYKKKVRDAGVRFSILPFNGEYGGRRYPAGYTEDEKRIIVAACADDEVNRKTFEFRKEESSKAASCEKPGARLCGMGCMYARIYPDGSSKRCCAKDAPSLGNIYDGTFALYDEPRSCELADCPCWKRMTPGGEADWSRWWVLPYRPGKG